ncbi:MULTISPECIES: SCO family protein [unclassified Planococcus (in: firmicutes)]|uniref:SCO family protein n=1 Tax=unclassified Planococcus (in: firmicutes) TaxID=2662419 RepID=UPI001F26B958|nr:MULTISPECIES: SCO family protein [unclassified Planococcus (in: firmicutes)]UJF27229.1 SCO family protein [Planococcus sp. 107-1]GKW46409.1 cysteine ABC transporter ATP-binding protein [Planococcus sp. NCCP-2050]
MLRNRLLTLLILLFILLLAGCGKGIEDPLEWKIEDFNFTNQDNEEMGLADLKGEVWLADFIFTNCTTVCLPMTANMVDLQNQFKEQGLDVQIVSFSVDPTVDSPEILKSYAENYGADFASWNLLTGYSPEKIDAFAMENFKTIARKPANDDQVLHGTSFFLVDKNGVIMKDYNGVNPPVEEIIADAEILLAEE